MTFNLLNNSPCLEIDGKEWTKDVKIGTFYVVGNRIIISNNRNNGDNKPELLHLSIDLKCFENFLTKSIPDQISLNQNFKLLTCQFKVNQLRNDFHSIKSIGKGGFGRVYSAISNIDWQMYAIKKVIINKSQFNKKEIADTLREFRILAKLNHCNIVRYHTAWIEQISTDMNNFVEDNDHSGESVSMSTNKISSSSSSINNSRSLSKSANRLFMSSLTNITISNSESESINSKKLDFNSVSTKNKKSQSGIVFDDDSSNYIPDKNSSDSLNSKNEQNGTLELYKGYDNNAHNFDYALYIQMELCHYNLQDWLEMRNKQPGDLDNIDMTNIRCLSRQLLKGVEYIHSNKIIHRDIKPANIFITIHSTNNLQLKIGDFGLSKLFEYDLNEEIKNTQKMKLTANIGTVFYTAPEVVNTNHKLTKYNHKCDLYSVGIILLELLVKFTTSSELSRVFTNLSNGIMFNKLMEMWPLEAPHVSNLISNCPDTRPEAHFILNQTCCFKESIVKNGFYEHIKNLMSENSKLKIENETLRKTLDNILLSQNICN